MNSLTGAENMAHKYLGYDSLVINILTGTEDMTDGECMSSRVMRI